MTEEHFDLCLSLLKCQLDLLSGKSDWVQDHGDITEITDGTKKLLARYNKIKLGEFGQYESIEDEDIVYKLRRFDRGATETPTFEE